MKNKGRKHKHGIQGIGNTKSMIAHITRPIESMSSRDDITITTFDKKKWSKRVRGYNKSQTKQINQDE